MERPLQVDPKDQRGAGGAHHEDVQSGDDANPEMQLNDRAPYQHREIMKLFRGAPAIHG